MRTVEEAFKNPELFTTCAMAILMDRFDADFINWEQETLEMEIRTLCSNPDPGLFDKVSAGCTILGTNLPHTDALTFNNIMQVLNFDDIAATSYMPATIEDILWGCAEMRLLEGPEEYDEAGFSADIAAMVGNLLVFHGILTPPSVLEFAEIDEKAVIDRDDNLGADSLMFEAYWEEQRDAVDDMEEFVKKRTDKLLAQLVELPLKDASEEFLKTAKSILKDNLTDQV
jgi:hypothetical protein